jgi:hypothetical protein
MRLFVSRRAVHRWQLRAMTRFFLLMGLLALTAALVALGRHVTL